MTQNEENEKFLNVYARKIKERFPITKSVLFEENYADIENENLKAIFATLQALLTDLFEYMNSKNNPGIGGHYNADPSRDLLDTIDFVRIIHAQLKNSPLSFRLDQDYEQIIDRSRLFLKRSGGSPIPEDFPHVDVIEHKPIFYMQDIIEVQHQQNVSSYPTKVIGRGSYATVSRYTDTYYNQVYVLKKAHANLDDKELERFKNEYLTLSKLDSLHVIKVFNYNDEKNEYTMEYADFTLEKFISLNNNKLSMRDRIKIILQLFRAFNYIHKKGILHRDISYQNILIQIYDDGTQIVKLSDFGLVKLRESSLTSDDSSIKGSLNDSSLALVGFANYEVRHEIFALSQVISFVLSGRTSTNSIFDKTASAKEFILKGMNPILEQRYSNIDEMENAFLTIRGELLSIDN